MHGCVTLSYRTLVIFILVAGGATSAGSLTGCQQSSYVTRAELDRLLDARKAVSTTPHDLALTQQMQTEERIPELTMRSAALAGAAAPAPELPPGLTAQDLDTTLKNIAAAVAVAGQNLANANTVGYKLSVVSFKPGSAGIAQHFDMTMGAPARTDHDLDLAIDGPGFFCVKTTADGPVRYTRSGNFFVNPSGEIVLGCSDGLQLECPIAVPRDATSVKVTRDGMVTAEVPDSVTPQNIGQIQIARFVSPEKLRSDNGSLFEETEESGAPILGDPGDNGAGEMLQSYLENSNVDLAQEMTTVIRLRRWYESVWQARQALLTMTRSGPKEVESNP